MTTGRVESKKRGKGGREKETRGGIEKVSRGREMTERGDGETDESRGGMVETERGRRCLLLGSRLIGSSYTSTEKNWLKKINPELFVSPPSDEEMNLIDLPPLTKKQWVCYLPKKTLEQRRAREEIAKELGIEPMGGENPCEKCANFSILCLP